VFDRESPLFPPEADEGWGTVRFMGRWRVAGKSDQRPVTSDRETRTSETQDAPSQNADGAPGVDEIAKNDLAGFHVTGKKVFDSLSEQRLAETWIAFYARPFPG